MTKTFGPNLGLLENAATGEAHDAELRALLRGLDGLVMPNVKGYLTNTPPGSPTNGDAYIIGAAPAGAWAGKGGYVTRYSTVAAAWEFYLPKNGWILQANSARESYRYTGGAWEIYYQEGTWTPQIIGATTPGTQTYSMQWGSFTKTGRMVLLSGRVTLTSTSGAAGYIVIPGVPFASSAASRVPARVIRVAALTGNDVSTLVGTYLASSTGIILAIASGAVVDSANLTATTGFDVQLMYES